jgi:hypothetical protein
MLLVKGKIWELLLQDVLLRRAYKAQTFYEGDLSVDRGKMQGASKGNIGTIAGLRSQ